MLITGPGHGAPALANLYLEGTLQEFYPELPILHVNGYKISNPTIFGSMSDDEIRSLFTGYGWKPRFVEGSDLSASMAAGMDWALEKIREIQQAARGENPVAQPRWPMLIMRSSKGWTGVESFNGNPVEGSFRAHQVAVKDAKENPAPFANCGRLAAVVSARETL